MKQNVLQIIVPIYGNQKKLKKFIGLLEKYIRKQIGIQKRGKRRWSLRKTICGILYYLKTGCQWRFLPNIFGNWKTIYGWYSRFVRLEIFKNLWLLIVKHSVNQGILKLRHLLCDGSLILTTSNISIKSKNPRMKNKNCVNRIVLTDKNGQPIALHLAKGTAHDTNFLIPLVDQLKQHVELPKNFMTHADKGFDSLHNRWQISLRGGRSEIPVRNHGFLVEYPKTKDLKRPIVEHFFAWINAFKALKTISTKKLSHLYENHFCVFSVILSRNLKLKDFDMLLQSI